LRCARQAREARGRAVEPERSRHPRPADQVMRRMMVEAAIPLCDPAPALRAYPPHKGRPVAYELFGCADHFKIPPSPVRRMGVARGRARALCQRPVTVAEEPSSALSGTFSHCFATGEGGTIEGAAIRRRASHAIALPAREGKEMRASALNPGPCFEGRWLGMRVDEGR
jgi:hypothetical protein